MSAVDTTNLAAVRTTDAGFFSWIGALFVRLLGLAGESPRAQARPAADQVTDSSMEQSDDTFVVAPGGYQIRVPHPSDVGHSVGDMLPSVREGLSLLPPLPTVVVELLREIQDPKSTAASVAEVASSDPSLAASLLRTANGAAMGISRTITSVSEAVSYLGFGTVKAMVIRLRLDTVLMPKNEESAQDAEDLWVHSLAVSYAAECLAQRVAGVDGGFVATLGLLHDVGKLAILAQLPDEAAKLREPSHDPSIGRLAREASILGLDHAGLGANLAAKWKLPADLVQAIRWHHRPADAYHPADPLPLRKALHIVQIANQLVKYCFPHLDAMEVDAVGNEAFDLLGLNSSLAKLLDKPVRDAITRAMFFAESNTRRPAGAPRRFMRPVPSAEAVRIAALSDGPEPRIGINDALIGELFSSDVPDVSASAASQARLSSMPHIRCTTSATSAGIPKCLAIVKAHLDELNLPLETRSVACATLKSLLPNLQSIMTASETIEVAQRRQEGRLTIAVRSPGLATARHINQPATVDATRRVAEADFANLLNLGWFQRIAISSDGSAVALEGH